MGNANGATVDGAAHFMIATHPGEVARLLAEHAHRAEAAGAPPTKIEDFSAENQDVLNDTGSARRHGGSTPTRTAEPFAHNS